MLSLICPTVLIVCIVGLYSSDFARTFLIQKYCFSYFRCCCLLSAGSGRNNCYEGTF